MKYIWLALSLLYMTSCSEKGTNKAFGGSDTEAVTSPFLIGERIDGPANIRLKPNGKILFTLNDGVTVETTPSMGNWLQVALFIDLTPEQIKSALILPGTLLTRNNKPVGRAVDTIDTWMDRGDGAYVSGYSHSNNIKENSYPEDYLTYLIDQGNTSIQAFKDFMSEYKFEKIDNGNLPDIEEYFIHESLIVDPSPRDRITLLFKNDKLMGLIHSRPLPTRLKTFDLIRGHKLSVTAELSGAEIRDLVDKKMEFYNSVD